MKSRLVRAVWYGFGVIAMVLAVHSPAQAGATQVVPEIDGSTLAAGIGLLASGVLIVRSRMQSK